MYNRGYFLPSRCSWLKTQYSTENVSLTMKSKRYQASCVGSFGFSQYLSPGTDPCIWQLNAGEVYFKKFGVIIKTSMRTKGYQSTVPVGPYSTQQLIWKLATRIGAVKHIACSWINPLHRKRTVIITTNFYSADRRAMYKRGPRNSGSISRKAHCHKR